MTRGFRAVRLSLLLVPLVLWSTPGAAQPAGTMTWGVHVTLATRWLDPAETESEITPFMILYALQPDAVAGMPEGMVVANGAITYRRAKTLIGQLAELGIKPADVTYVAVSHTHGDHVGNVALFPTSTVLIQAAEYDWAMAGPAKPAFASTQMIKKLAGDHDVFGDGSVKIVSTPGHTPGHQSLLVSLPKTGAL